MLILLAAIGGLIFWLALRSLLPARIWADLQGALDYLVRFAAKAAVVILALVILVSIYQSVHG